MPRRKQNVDAFGKSWSPIDLPNLEKAVRLYERLNYLQDHFAGSLSGANKIMAQINEQAEIKEELQKLGIKHNEEELKQIIKLIQQRQNENRMLDAGIKGSTSGVINYKPTQSLYGPATSYYKPTNVNGQVNSSNLGNAVASGLMNRRMVSSEMQRMRDAGSIMSDASLRRAAQINVQNGNAVMTKELEKFGSKMDTVGSIFQVAVNTFSKAVNVFSELFFGGMRRQANTYEDTFTNISVRTGMTRGQYLSNQTGAASYLRQNGLAGNVRVSDVQKTWDTLASTGMGQEKIIANAIDTVITQTIVPYLNANDAYFQQLIEQQPALMKQIRGIGAATQEVSGSSVFINKYLQDMIDSLSPMAAVAENELGVQYAQMSGMYESLRAQGLSDAAIGSMYKGAAAVYRDPLAALRSGNLDNQLAVVNGIVNGIDFRDAAQVNGQYIGAANFVSRLTPGGRMAPIFAGMSNTALDTMTKVELGERNLNIAQALANGNLVGSKVNSAGDRKTEDFRNNVNNTMKQIQENELENISTWLAAIYEQIGYWGDILAVLVKGIAGVVGAKIIGGIGKKILGLGGKGGGAALGTKLAGNIAANGGLGATTVAGAALTATAGVAGIAGGIYGVNKGVGQLQEAGKGYNDAAYQRGMGIANVAGGGAAIAGGAMLAGGVAASMMGVGVANAWNPVGWVLLAAGGIAMLGAAIAETVDHATDANKIYDQLQEQTRQEINQEKLQNEQEMQYYYNFQAAIDQATDVEVAKKLAVQAGIATEEELTDKKYDEIDAVKDLVDEFINQKRKLSEDSLGTYSALKTTLNKEQSEFTADFLNKFIGKNYNIQSGDDTWAVNMYGQQIQAMAYDYLNQGIITDKGNGKYEGQKGNDVAKHLAWMMEQGLLYHDYTDGNLTWEDYDMLFTKGTDKDRRLVGEAMLRDSTYRNNILSNESTRKIFGYKYQFRLDPDGSQAKSLLGGLFAAAADGDKEGVQKYVDQLKLLGYKSEDFGSSSGTIINALNSVGIDSFRSGLPYVPYDDYIANLHQGEAVITAATANELRSLITEYRESQQVNTSLDAAIQTQTATLVNKIDEVIQVVQNNSLFKAPSQNKVKEMFNNMKYVRSTKSFNQ